MGHSRGIPWGIPRVSQRYPWGDPPKYPLNSHCSKLAILLTGWLLASGPWLTFENKTILLLLLPWPKPRDGVTRVEGTQKGL